MVDDLFQVAWETMMAYGMYKVSTISIACHSSTLPETNIAPENRPSQKETSIPTVHF